MHLVVCVTTRKLIVYNLPVAKPSFVVKYLLECNGIKLCNHFAFSSLRTNSTERISTHKNVVYISRHSIRGVLLHVKQPSYTHKSCFIIHTLKHADKTKQDKFGFQMKIILESQAYSSDAARISNGIRSYLNNFSCSIAHAVNLLDHVYLKNDCPLVVEVSTATNSFKTIRQNMTMAAPT